MTRVSLKIFWFLISKDQVIFNLKNLSFRSLVDITIFISTEDLFTLRWKLKHF